MLAVHIVGRTSQYANHLELTFCSKLLRCDYSWTAPQSQPDHPPSPNSTSATALIVRSCSGCIDLSTSAADALLQACGSDHSSPELVALTSEILQYVHVTPLELLDDYCANIHPGIPLLDSTSLRHRLTSWHHRLEDNLALLVLALLLVTRRPCIEGHPMNSLLYKTIKNGFLLHSSIYPSLETNQSGLLIAYYACGHALPRDAHMVLATCVTVARLLGMDFGDMVAVSDSHDQMSACKWAMVLLDRFVNLPHKC
jgi:hypothetical protein